jgi:hypothetical protein
LALPYNLIYICDRAKLGWTTVIKAKNKGGVNIKFDIVVNTNHGWLYAIQFKRGAGQFVGQFALHYIVQ